jgi:hypothetical protein
MLILALIGLAASIVVTEWLWRRTSRFLIYQGESRIRRGRSLAHLNAEHYRPEGLPWLSYYRWAFLAMNIMLGLSLWTLVSRF